MYISNKDKSDMCKLVLQKSIKLYFSYYKAEDSDCFPQVQLSHVVNLVAMAPAAGNSIDKIRWFNTR